MRLRPLLLALAISWFPLVLLSSVTGCSCSQTTTTAEDLKKKLEDEKKKKAKPKPDYEMGLLTVQPNNLVDRQFFVKPRHLSSVSVDLIANNYDIRGTLATDPLDLAGVPYQLGNVRQAILPKDQKRNLELIIQYPEQVRGEDREDLKHFSCRLNGDGGRMLINTPARLSRMPAHQFYFFVLAKSQDSYKFFSQLPSFKPTASPIPGDDPQAFYRLVLPPVIQRTPLPSTPLAWTSIAYVLWDDMPRDSLSLEQQEALVDWLHWGGQLIVSGPGSLTLLKQSFLDPYLPADAGGTFKLEAPDVAAMGFAEGSGWRGPAKLNRAWECQELRPKRTLGPDEGEGSWSEADRVLAWTGADRKPLVVERTVGRGRVVVTAFRLNQPEIAEWRTNWPEFDEFFNGFVLRRLPRAYHLAEIDVAGLAWRSQGGGQLIAQSPRVVSRIEYFSRDTGAESHKPSWLKGAAREQILDQFGRVTNDPIDELDRFEGAGPAAWDDFNDVAFTARASIEDAAGIKVPERMFVVRTLAWYLFVLVPVNWCFFALIRRLEWAWVAVPIITIAFTGIVVKLAELNIGFARSRTEIAVVEVQGDHPRAHLTRYTALYTSLSTRYDVRLTDPSGAVMPLSGKEALAPFQLQSRRPLWLERDDEVRLQGFEVSSNSRGILHAEQMFALGGPIKATELSNDVVAVANDSNYELRDAKVVGPQGMAVLGTIAPGGKAEGRFQAIPAPQIKEAGELGESEESPQTPAKKPASDQVQLDSLLNVALRGEHEGVRLIAWSEDPLPGMEVEPQASQNRHANMFVVHLRPPPLPKPAVDQFVDKARDAFLKKPVRPKASDELEIPMDDEPGSLLPGVPPN